MAVERLGITLTAEAASDLSSAQYKFVKLTSADKVDTVSAVGVDVTGVLQNDPTAGQWATVAVSGRTKIVAGAAITRGARIRSDSSGRAVTADSDESCGICRETASAAGDIVSIELTSPTRVGINHLGSFTTTTATGNITLVTTDTTYQRIDPGGASRDVTLPAVASSRGRAFLFMNQADAAENLVVKNAGGSTIVTYNQNEGGWVVCDGATWVHMGVLTIAQT